MKKWYKSLTINSSVVGAIIYAAIIALIQMEIIPAERQDLVFQIMAALGIGAAGTAIHGRKRAGGIGTDPKPTRPTVTRRNIAMMFFIALLILPLAGCDDKKKTDPTGPAGCMAYPDIKIDTEDPCSVWVNFIHSDGCDILIAYLIVDTYQRASYTGEAVKISLDPWTDVHYLTAEIHFTDGTEYIMNDWPGFRSPGCWSGGDPPTTDNLILIGEHGINSDDVNLIWTNTGADAYYVYRGSTPTGLTYRGSTDGWIPAYGEEAICLPTYFKITDSDGRESNMLTWPEN